MQRHRQARSASFSGTQERGKERRWRLDHGIVGQHEAQAARGDFPRRIGGRRWLGQQIDWSRCICADRVPKQGGGHTVQSRLHHQYVAGRQSGRCAIGFGDGGKRQFVYAAELDGDLVLGETQRAGRFALWLQLKPHRGSGVVWLRFHEIAPRSSSVRFGNSLCDIVHWPLEANVEHESHGAATVELAAIRRQDELEIAAAAGQELPGRIGKLKPLSVANRRAREIAIIGRIGKEQGCWRERQGATDRGDRVQGHAERDGCAVGALREFGLVRIGDRER